MGSQTGSQQSPPLGNSRPLSAQFKGPLSDSRRHPATLGLLSEALADTRVVLVNGARQAGKSTLTRLAADGRPGTVIRLLDDAATLRAAQDDPAGFVEHAKLMVIDEIQLAPELLRAIKVLVDTDPRPGRFVLYTGQQTLSYGGGIKALPIDALWLVAP